MDFTVEEIAAFLHVRPATVRARLRTGELQRSAGAGPPRVRLEPADYIRCEDAAAILGRSPTTVRAAIKRGELAGTRDRGGRWLVRLDSLLADPRATGAAAQLAAAPPPSLEADDPPVTTGALQRGVYVRLDAEECELLELASARHGSNRAAVATGLRVLVEQDATPGEVAELRVERDSYQSQLEQREAQLQELAGLARRQLVDELYCPQCEAMVPIDGWGYARDEQTGLIEIYHRRHGHKRKSRLSEGSVMARRQGPETQPETPGG